MYKKCYCCTCPSFVQGCRGWDFACPLHGAHGRRACKIHNTININCNCGCGIILVPRIRAYFDRCGPYFSLGIYHVKCPYCPYFKTWRNVKFTSIKIGINDAIKHIVSAHTKEISGQTDLRRA